MKPRNLLLLALATVLLTGGFACGASATSSNSGNDHADDDDDATPPITADDNDNDNDNDNDDQSPDDDASPADDDASPPESYPLLDAEGRTLILHGANFQPIEDGGQAVDYQRMAAWGFNAVRMVLTWEGLEPEQGAYDETYLPDVVEPQVQFAYEAGLHVILNMHQYHWSKCCGGMGMPDWTCQDIGDPPLEWLWQSGLFWNHDDYVAGFAAAWGKVAEYFAGDDRVFAYDLFNEPLAGLRTLPWLMDNQLLRPLYEQMIAAIRAFDAAPRLFIEPPMISLIGFPFTMTPIDAAGLIYSPHLYPGTISDGGDYDFPESLLENQLDLRQRESVTQKTPLLIGETGIASSVAHAEQYARDAVDLFEADLASWTWWTFHYDAGGMGLCEVSGQPKDLFYRHLAQPYPRLTAGVLQSFQFAADTAAFTVAFDNRPDLAPSVEIFVNAGYFYPNGFVVRSTDAAGSWSYAYDSSSGSLTVACDPHAENHVVTVEAVAANAAQNGPLKAGPCSASVDGGLTASFDDAVGRPESFGFAGGGSPVSATIALPSAQRSTVMVSETSGSVGKVTRPTP